MELALGAEYKVQFHQSGVIRRGSVDCYYGNLIIEFEKDLRATGEHALEQLRAYVAGAWAEDGSADRPYLAVAADGMRWRVFTPEPSPAGVWPVHAEHVRLALNEDFAAEASDPEALRHFLNRLFVRRDLLKPTAANFTRDFGLHSPAFSNARLVLAEKLVELHGDSQRQLLQSEWDSALRVAYGGSVANDELFIRHTYLASLARLLVFSALERRPLRDDEVADVLNGDYFRGRQLANIAESDFFSWHHIPSSTQAERVWIALSRQLAGYDLAHVDEDILKPLYETLVDPEFRHDLGEYYTPDWLAVRVVRRLLKDWDWSQGVPAVVDPACGSGTFLRAAIAEARSHLDAEKREQLRAVLASVVGVDVHPLAVIIARATYVLALAELVAEATQAIAVPVYLADSLETADLPETRSLFGEAEVTVEVGAGVWARSYPLPVSLIRAVSVFDAAVEVVLAIAGGFAETSEEPERAGEVVERQLARRLAQWPEAVLQLSAMATHLVTLIRARQDSLWGFLLRNRHRPAMLKGSFDFVVGNPPWLTIGAIKSTAYKESVVALAKESGIAPRGRGEQAHTELATLFIPQAYRLFAKRNTQRQSANVGFVMPRSLMTATHHRLLREGGYKDRFVVSELWDLEKVQPLFNVPACVVFFREDTPSPERLFKGYQLSGNLPAKDAPAAVVDSVLASKPMNFRLLHLARRTAWASAAAGEHDDGLMAPPSAYVGSFRQGAIIYPQMLFAVVSDDGKPIRRSVEHVRVRPDPRARAAAKLLKSLSEKHLIETRVCFSSLAAEHLMPWGVRGEPWTVVLPAVVDPSSKSFAPVPPARLLEEGLIRAARWLSWANQQWGGVRKAGDNTDIWTRLDYLGQLSAQAGRQRYVVLYTASGARAVAAYLDTDGFALPFVARDKTYWAAFDSEEEAAFVCAFVNAEVTLNRVAHFMTRGLQGARDTHKRILDVPFPPYDPEAPLHGELAAASAEIAASVRGALQVLPAATNTGRARQVVRNGIDSRSLERVEELVKLLIERQEQVVPRVVRR